jgi:hypothetical protein
MDFWLGGLILESLEADDANSQANRAGLHTALAASFTPRQNKSKEVHAMTKSLEAMSESIRDPKHPFRKVDDQPKKPRKHRYERRKIKEYLHLGEWVTSEAT